MLSNVAEKQKNNQKQQEVKKQSITQQQRANSTASYRQSFYNGEWQQQQKQQLPISSTGQISNNENCNVTDCKRRVYKRDQCKQHFISNLMKALRKELRNLYRGPDKAYAALDFTGIGHITLNDFLSSLICKRVPYTLDEIKDFFFQTNAFAGGSGQVPVGGMNFDSFKKMFFPHLYLIQDSNNEDIELNQEQRLKNLIVNQVEHQEQIQQRVQKLEKKLKLRFSNFDSVRKAFLGLDTDYDGYITVEDILRYFGQDSKDFNFNDLKKLITEKDSTGQGRLGYADFSKWVGNSIHQSEGFYFRHDSVKNPMFEQNRDSKAMVLNEKCKQEASKQLVNQTLEKTIIDKIKFQWKTIRKAFTDMNKERDAAIAEDELRFYMKHWGLNLTDEQFSYIFKKFDVDGDGMISYSDFHKAVGSEIHPGESLYFRQDKPQMMRINKCQHDKCWQPTPLLGANFCALHSKMYIDQGIQLFQRLFAKIGRGRWPEFIKAVRVQAERDEDYQQIFFDRFSNILKDKFGIKLTQNESQMLQKTFPGRNEGDKIRINIQKLYEVNYNNRMTKVYDDVTIQDGDDQAVDQSGFIGVFHRKNKIEDKAMQDYSMEQLAQIFVKMNEHQRNDTLATIMRTIKQIDKDNNGYVTSTELDDILKLTFPFLDNKRLKLMFKEFESIQNKILIDYKRFRDRLLSLIKGMIDKQSAIEDKKKQIAEKLQKMRESQTTIMGARQRSMEYNRNDEKQFDSRLNQSAIDITLKQQSRYQENKDQDFQVSPVRKLIKFNSKNQGQQINNSINFNKEQFTSKNDLKTPIILNKSELKIGKQNNQAFISSFALPKGSLTALNASSNKYRENSEALAKSIDYGKNRSLIRKTLLNNDSSQTIQHDYHHNQSPFNPYMTLAEGNNSEPKGFRSTSRIEQIDSAFRKNNATQLNQYNEERNKLTKNEVLQNHMTQRPGSTLIRLSTSSFKPNLSKHLTTIRSKVQIEWKNIYRLLSSNDNSESGIISKKNFEDALQAYGVFISNEELKHVLTTFGDNKGHINYKQMSEEFGLHQKSFNLMRATHSMINRIKTESRQQNFPKACYSTNYMSLINKGGGTLTSNAQ